MGKHSFKEGFSYTARRILSTVFVIIVALIVLFTGKGEGLSHPIWCKIFTLVFLLFLWISINFRICDFAADFIKESLADAVPRLNLPMPFDYICLAVFVLPALVLFGAFVSNIVSVAVVSNGNTDNIGIALIGVVPLIGELFSLSDYTLSLSELSSAWGTMIVITYGFLIIFISGLVVSALAKLMAGSFSYNIGFRILIGFSMFVYMAYLPDLIFSLIDGSPLSPENVQNLFLAIDQAHWFLMIIGYIILSFVLAVVSSYIVWPFIVFLLFALVISFIPSLNLFISDNEFIIFVIIGAFLIGKEVWGSVPD